MIAIEQRIQLREEIDVTGDSATGIWRFTRHYIDAVSGQLHHIIGRQKDRFVRVEGHWLLQAFIAHVEFLGIGDGRVDETP